MQSKTLTHETPYGEYGAHTEYSVVARPYKLADHKIDHEGAMPWMIDVVITIREIGDGGAVLSERMEADLYPTYWASKPTLAQLERDAQDVYDALIENLRIKAEDWA